MPPPGTTREGRNALLTAHAARAAVFFSTRIRSRTWMAISLHLLQTKQKTVGLCPRSERPARNLVLGHPVSGQTAPTTGERAGDGAIRNEAQHCATSFRDIHARGVAMGRYQAHARRVNDKSHSRRACAFASVRERLCDLRSAVRATR